MEKTTKTESWFAPTAAPPTSWPTSPTITTNSAEATLASSTFGVRITKDVDQSLAGRDVLLVEDIYDTGETLNSVHELVNMHGPASLEIRALLQKRKQRQFRLNVKYIGFDIDDVFVVGYGLDYKERYRQLSCVGELKPEIYDLEE